MAPRWLLGALSLWVATFFLLMKILDYKWVRPHAAAPGPTAYALHAPAAPFFQQYSPIFFENPRRPLASRRVDPVTSFPNLQNRSPRGRVYPPPTPSRRSGKWSWRSGSSHRLYATGARVSRPRPEANTRQGLTEPAGLRYQAEELHRHLKHLCHYLTEELALALFQMHT